MKRRPTIITMGTFDGVHIGHQKLLKELIKQAKKNNGISTVLTYYHHPLESLKKMIEPYLLTEKNEKKKILQKFGVEQVIFLDFNQEFSQMTPHDFIKNILVDKFSAKIVVAGYDTHFGKNRSGNYHLLKQFAEKYNYKAIRVEALKKDGKIITSSYIRELVKKGKIEMVNKLQGHLFSVFGKVVHGEKLGKQLGYPTLNLEPYDKYKLFPHTGIYLSAVKFNHRLHFGMTNVGFSPTLKTSKKVEIETYIFDFSDKLYDKDVCIIFLEKLREEIKFYNKEELIRQIANDVEQGKILLQNKYSHLMKEKIG